MICKTCNVHMVPGTSYANGISRRYDKCPKCYFKKFIKADNRQEPKDRKKNHK